MFELHANLIDKTLPVPVGAQLFGLLSYTISHGDVSFGTRLPSVRDLAHGLGLAPMTVTQVYNQLRRAGLIEIHRGLGAFTARDPKRLVEDVAPRAELRRKIDALIDHASALGMTGLDLITMINAQSRLRLPPAPLSIVFVGVFEDPAREYAEAIRATAATVDRVEVTTLERLRTDPAARRLCLAADAVITFVYREAEIRKLIPSARVLAIRFIPSNLTRQSLAALDPRCRLLAVTHFEEYIAIMRPSIRLFAPHVVDIRVTWAAAPDLTEALADRDTVVFASGAGHVADLVRPQTHCFEYRHMPDPGELETILAPYLAERRRTKAVASGKLAVSPATAAAPLPQADCVPNRSH